MLFNRNFAVRSFTGLLLIVTAMACFNGCTQQGISGGSIGQLLAGDVPLGQMQVIVHEPEGITPIAIGFTDASGSFDLVAPDASRPIVLSAREYRWTVQSVGAEVEIPKKFMQPDQSDLSAVWDEHGNVTLALPALRNLKVTR